MQVRAHRRGLVGPLIGLLVAAALIVPLYLGVPFLAVWQRSLSDLLFAGRATSERIVIVEIDDKSLSEVGRWPWGRDYHARLLDSLQKAGAKAIGFDVSFSEPSSVASDTAFADALRQDGRVVLASVFELRATQDDAGVTQAIGMQELLPAFAAAAAGTGHANVIPDADGVVRTVPLFLNYEGANSPALSLALLSEAEPEDPVTATDKRVSVAGREIPLETGGRMRINFAGPEAFERVSYSDVVSGRVEPALFKDKIVLVGMTAEGLGDRFNTPGADGVMVPGVELHANAIDTVLSGAFVVPEPKWRTAIGVTILAVVCAVACSRLRSWVAALVAVTLVVLSVGFVIYRFDQGVLGNLVYPAVAVAVAYASSTTYRVVVEAGEKRRVESLFGRYVKPEIVQQMISSSDEDIASLRGTEQLVTILFADLRGFTSLSEQLSAVDVVSVLNSYLGAATDAVFSFDGTLDKYMGDCVMAFWNAPHEQEDHCLRAVHAALAIQRATRDIEIGQFESLGCPPPVFGVGIATGHAVVGNIGSTKRSDYTVVGNSVNLASRLCGSAPAGQVLVSPDTYQAIQDLVDAERLPPQTFKGIAEPISPFVIRGLIDRGADA